MSDVAYDRAKGSAVGEEDKARPPTFEVGISKRLVAKKAGDERASEGDLWHVVEGGEGAVSISAVEHAVSAALCPQSEGVDINHLEREGKGGDVSWVTSRACSRTVTYCRLRRELQNGTK